MKTFQWAISKTSGSIEQYVFNGTDLLVDSMSLNFWRAPVDNDFGNGMPKRCAIWKEDGQQPELLSYEVKKTDSAYLFLSLFQLAKGIDHEVNLMKPFRFIIYCLLINPPIQRCWYVPVTVLNVEYLQMGIEGNDRLGSNATRKYFDSN